MKKGLLLLALVGISFGSIARQYPPEWVQYTSGGYLSDIQSDHNSRNQSETEFKNYLLNIARTNLAKQVRIQVQDFAELKKKSIDGRTAIAYSSETQFSTDVDLKLVETKTFYDSETKEGYAIAYIDKNVAGQYYQNEINIFLNKADNSMAIARDYIDSGFKSRAKAELEAILSAFEATDEAFFWLNIFGSAQSESGELLIRRNDRERNVKQMLADLQYGTAIYLTCSADIFGSLNTSLQSELKGKLAAEGCHFVDDPAQADWVICICASAREYNHLTTNAQSLYFAYVDANITIDKSISSQRICEDCISVKGGHTMNYKEAARVACKNLNGQLGTFILQNIQR